MLRVSFWVMGAAGAGALYGSKHASEGMVSLSVAVAGRGLVDLVVRGPSKAQGPEVKFNGVSLLSTETCIRDMAEV